MDKRSKTDCKQSEVISKDMLFLTSTADLVRWSALYSQKRISFNSNLPKIAGEV
jgi:hypothetical protein